MQTGRSGGPIYMPNSLGPARRPVLPWATAESTLDSLQDSAEHPFAASTAGDVGNSPDALASA